jgi:hypothetical protein
LAIFRQIASARTDSILHQTWGDEALGHIRCRLVGVAVADLAEGTIARMGSVGMWLALAAVIGVCIVVALGCMWLAYRILPESAGTEYNSSLSPFLTIIGLMFGALLGFTVVVAFEQFSSAGANVADEATTLTTMYRQTVTMPDPERTQIRQLLRVYTTAVKGPEWQSQKRGQANDTARSAITQMYRVIGNQQPSVANSPATSNFVGRLTVLSSDRNTRILDASPRIPPVLWCGLLIGAVILVTITGFMRLGNRRGHVVLCSAVAVLLGLLLFVIFSLDRPFNSQTGVTPTPFAHSLEVFDAVDHGK